MAFETKPSSPLSIILPAKLCTHLQPSNVQPFFEHTSTLANCKFGSTAKIRVCNSRNLTLAESSYLTFLTLHCYEIAYMLLMSTTSETILQILGWKTKVWKYSHSYLHIISDENKNFDANINIHLNSGHAQCTKFSQKYDKMLFGSNKKSISY